MIEGEAVHKMHVMLFKDSGKMYATGHVLVPDHWEVCGGNEDDLLRYIATKQDAVNPVSILGREFTLVIAPTDETLLNPETRYLYPRLVRSIVN